MFERLRVTRAIAMALLVAACSSGAPPTGSGASAAIPSRGGGVVGGLATASPASPSLVSATSAPTVSASTGVVSIPTQAPTPAPAATATPEATPEPTPEDTPEPTRTLAPGETPQPGPVDIAHLLVAQLDLLYIGDASINVTIDLVDPDSGKSGTVAAFELVDLDVASQSVPEGDYQMTFVRPGAPNDPAICLVEIRAGDVVTFVATDDTTMVIDENRPGNSRGDLVIETSPRCVKPANP